MQYNTRAALAYCGGRILWNKKRSKDQAARAMEVLASYDLNEDGENERVLEGATR